MQLFDRVCLRLCLLFTLTGVALVVPYSLDAQELVRIDVAAQITDIVDENSSYTGIGVGDVVTATLIYDQTAKPVQETGADTKFDLNLSGSGTMTLNVGGYTFVSTAASGGSGADGGILASISSRTDNSETPPRCFHNLDFSGLFKPEDGNVVHDEDQFFLSFSSSDCSRELNIDRLPLGVTLQDWDAAQLTVVRRDKQGGLLSFNAKVSYLLSDEIPGATVTGTVYADNDADCKQDADETGLRQRVVEFSPGDRFAITGPDGRYSAVLPLGDYRVKVLDRNPWQQNCPAGEANISLQRQGDVVESDFALTAKDALSRIDIRVLPRTARPGFPMSYNLWVHNSGSLPFTGRVRLYLQNLLTDFSSTPAADQYKNSTAEWELDAFPVDALMHIVVNAKVPADEALLGNELCAVVEAEVDENGTPMVLPGSMQEICQRIRGSYDPNDMRVIGVGGTDADGPVPADTDMLIYWIRFQNEGNEDAVTVRVVDQLSDHFSLEDFNPCTASHDFRLNIRADGKLEFIFDNINLPPKERDEAGSQGYIILPLKLKQGIPAGTDIANSAEIYFDFNKPIETNTVVSSLQNTTTTVDELPTTSGSTLFPNPATERLSVELNSQSKARLLLQDVLGRIMLELQMEESRQDIDVGHLPAGMYFLTIETDAGREVRNVRIER